MSRIFKRPDSPNWYYTNGSKSDRKKSTGTPNKKRATLIQDKWDEERLLLKNNIISHKQSIDSAIMDYVKLIEDKVGDSYLRKSKFTLNMFSELNPNRFVYDITINDIDSFIKSRSKSSPKTVRDSVHILNKWFAWAVRRKLTPSNPVEGVILPKLRSAKRKAIDPKLIKDAIKKATRENDRLYWSLLYYTGLRSMDAGRLKKEDIKKGLDGKPIIPITQSKTGTQVIIPLHKSLIGKNIFNLMPTTSKAQCSRERLQKIIPGSDLHSLRHSFATHLTNLGATTFEVKGLMGHQSNDVTMDYIHHNISKLRKLINLL